MLLRALCGLSFLLGGCAIHVVDQPVTPAATGPATFEVAEAPQAHRHPQRHPHAAEPAVVEQPTEPRESPRVARPARSDLTAHPVASEHTKPSRPSAPSRPAKPSRTDPPEDANKPLYTRFRDVGPQALPEPQSPVAPKPEPQSRHALKAGS
jgi:hypothetical protein